MKKFCTRINQDVDHEECYACFLKSSPYPGSNICRDKYLTEKKKETKAKGIDVYLHYDPKNNSKAHAKIIRYLNENNAYDFQFVNDLRGDFSVCCPGLNEPIFFEQKETRFALIMPIQLRHE